MVLRNTPAALRHELSALRRGSQLDIDLSKEFHVYARGDGQESMLMAFNHSETKRHFHWEIARTALAGSHSIAPLLDASPGQMSGITAT